MKTGKELLLAAVRGEPVERIPWTPRLDLWYRAHLRLGTLPDRWATASMWEIIRDIGGLLYYPNIPTWRTRMHGVEILETVDGDTRRVEQPFVSEFSAEDAWTGGRDWGTSIRTEYRTPRGSVSTTHIWTPAMAMGGVQAPQLIEHMIKDVKDYPVVEFLYEHTEYLPAYEILEQTIAEMGDDGVPIGGAGWTPIHLLMNEYIGYNQVFYHMADHPAQFERLLQVVCERTWAIREIAAASPAQIVMICCNWTDGITSPPIFRKYFVPQLGQAVDLMRAHGKLTSCHVDGDMKRLLRPFADVGVDVAEALAPSPLCNYTLAEARAVFGDRMTIWGGIPTPLFTDSFTDQAFDEYVRDVLRTVAPGQRFILAMGDNIPADGVFERVHRVPQLLNELGYAPTGEG